jgi:predicted nucleotidyltransferase
VADPPTPYLDELVARLRRVAGDRLVGVWLMGSAALGDFDPRRSDLDVQAVTSERLPLAEREAIVAALEHETLPVPARGLEFVLYAREDLEHAAYELNLNTGPRMDRHVSFDADGDPRFWFVIDLSIGREHARALTGPPAADVFPSLTRPLIAASLRQAMEFFAAEDPSGAQLVLAACRTWAWAAEGRWLSKGEAADWAQARLDDPAPVIDAAARRPVTAAAREAVVARARTALSA